MYSGWGVVRSAGRTHVVCALLREQLSDVDADEAAGGNVIEAPQAPAAATAVRKIIDI